MFHLTFLFKRCLKAPCSLCSYALSFNIFDTEAQMYILAAFDMNVNVPHFIDVLFITFHSFAFRVLMEFL